MSKDIKRNNDNLTISEERFCINLVSTGDKYIAWEKAGYSTKSKGSMQVGVCKLLKISKIQVRLDVLNMEYLRAMSVTDERIIGHLAEIAFNEDNNKQDRLRALEALSRQRAMFTDKLHTTSERVRELDEAETEEAHRLASIRLAEQAEA